MPRIIPPPLSLALTFLREARGWTQQELATAAGMKRQLLCDLEKGSRRTLERGLCEALVAAMGYGPGDVTLALLFVGGVRRAEAGPSATPLAASVEERRQAQQIASRAGLVESNRVYFQLLDLASSRRAERTRNAAKKAWESFRHLPVELQRQAVEKRSATVGWALVELLCDESVRAGYDDAARALDLARLAESAAECLPGEPDWRSHAQGYALAFRGNAQRIAITCSRRKRRWPWPGDCGATAKAPPRARLPSGGFSTSKPRCAAARAGSATPCACSTTRWSPRRRS